MKNKRIILHLIVVGCLLLLLRVPFVHSAAIHLANSPLLVTQVVPPLAMIVLSQDYKLFYEAYNDASDIDSDGQLDVGYNPNIDYYGYFDSFKCYTYDGGATRYVPASETSDKKCSGQWSGDYLNYLTTARIDVIRKVLYGGYRYVDTEGQTVLERTHITQDAHSWGKEYESITADGYDIADYTPFTVPDAGKYHLFANTTLLGGTGEPLLRVHLNDIYRIWEWVSIDRPVAGNKVLDGGSGPTITPTDHVVRVEVCVKDLEEANCQIYPSENSKPVGLLHFFGESEAVKFGLVTGSFTKNLSGGVLRKNIREFTDEIDPSDGTYTSTVGIVKTIDRLMIPGFQGAYIHDDNCGFIFNRDIVEGECRAWGNPIAEMMYETVRYFAGKGAPTPDFTYTTGDDVTMGLPLDTWNDPFDSDENPYCAKPVMLVISDVYPSYDTDKVPGTYFGSFSGDLSPSLNASALGDVIWNSEGGGSSLHMIGQSGATYDGAPSAKTVTSFGNIRGLSPEEPSKEGGYYAASVAYYGSINDVHTAQDDQNITVFSVAFASHVPNINIQAGNNIVTLVPFGKSVGDCGGINPNPGEFQPTNTIVDFYVDTLSASSGTFRINYEDAQQGADHDMDAIVMYNYVVNPDDTVTVTLNSIYAAGCVNQHLGYFITGTTSDGIYLEVRDLDTSSGNDTDYFLDTPNLPSVALPLLTSRNFSGSGSPAATLLNNPLWYAAKYGGFDDSNSNDLPDLTNEWDSNQDGIPDNYFLVTNALTLEQQLTIVFSQIASLNSSAAGAASNSDALIDTVTNGTRFYQALFNSGDWTGQLLSFMINSSDGTINTSGPGPNGSQWDLAEQIDLLDWDTGRQIISFDSEGKAGIPFRWNNLNSKQQDELNKSAIGGLDTTTGEDRLEYIRGNDDLEQSNSGPYRDRVSNMGDIVHSTAVFVAAPKQLYPDFWPSGSPENAVPYSAFKFAHLSRAERMYIGANEGLLHVVDADDGTEVLAYVPSKVIQNLNQLTSPEYLHKYYVDAAPTACDVFYDGAWHTVVVGGLNKGGKSVYALEITDPSTFEEGNAANQVLWEFDENDSDEMGFSYSRPGIARLASGVWAAVFGNGYNNTEKKIQVFGFGGFGEYSSDIITSQTGHAVLFIVDIKTGALIKKINTKVGIADDPTGQGRPNGLATPALVDVNGDSILDYVYVGDLFGNMWKFDVSSTNVSDWDSAFTSGSDKIPLFVAKDSSGNVQPITSRPVVGSLERSTTNGVIVYFGTGKFLGERDKNTQNVNTQTYYGIYDEHTTQVLGRAELLKQSIIDEIIFTGPETHDVRITTDNEISDSDRGWYIDLIVNGASSNYGERQVSDSVLRNGRIIFSTLLPSIDVCAFGGNGWVMELHGQDGAPLVQSTFDLNSDGIFNKNDLVEYDSGGGVIVTTAVTGIKSTVGAIPTPTIIAAGDVEYIYTPGSSGDIEMVVGNPGANASGRQSWRQMK